MPQVDVDQLNSTSRDKAAYTAFEALNAIQNDRPHVQVFAVSLLFSAFCHRLGLDPQEMHSKGMKMLADERFHHKANVQLDAIRDFAGIRLTNPKHGVDDNNKVL